ncbi:formylglycine-generating enzyme family protein [Dermacoccaceae bacterium W4C1]
MGSDDRFSDPDDGESPARPVRVRPFSIAATAVTAAQFAAFVTATGYRTLAQRSGWSFVFEGLATEAAEVGAAVAEAPWWKAVPGADWAHPHGPGSHWQDAADHPVVHVTAVDARAYCAWSGTRLPDEAQWEYAARGGLQGATFPWGQELTPAGEHRMNVWQGAFPQENTAADGWVGTAPVRSYPPNGFGLFEVTGNVWEWTSSRWAPQMPDLITKGGSYLCHASYCRRYRPAARQRSPQDTSTGNLGFRVAGCG